MDALQTGGSLDTYNQDSPALYLHCPSFPSPSFGKERAVLGGTCAKADIALLELRE